MYYKKTLINTSIRGFTNLLETEMLTINELNVWITNFLYEKT